MPDDIISEMEIFMNSGKIGPKLFFFQTKLMKAITKTSWDPFKKKINKYYTKINAQDE